MSSKGKIVAILISADGSLSPSEIALSADELADVRFLADSTDASGSPLLDVMRSLAPTYLTDFSDPDACLAVVRGMGADAVATFVDSLCGLAARLDSQLRCQQDGPQLWGRKDVQRRLLFEAGVSRVESATVADADDLNAFVREVGYPVVVKPVDGVASRGVRILRNPSDAREFLDGQLSLAAGTRDQMFVEDYIESPERSGVQPADYVSAEMFRSIGRAGTTLRVAAFVTDRLPLAWPCRETAMLLPSALPLPQAAAVTERAWQALEVLRARRGVFHVEIKPGGSSPEIIEVNGRLGGFVARLAHLSAPGVDLARVALSCYLDATEPFRLDWKRCAGVLFFPPPPRASRVACAPSREEVARLPGAAAVEDVRAEGSVVEWRLGTNYAASARVWLTADDRATLMQRLLSTAEFLTESFTYLDENGSRVEDKTWIDTLLTATANS